MASRIGVFRQKVALGRYELTGHAKDEMEQDGLTILDVKAAIYSGTIVQTQRHGRSRRKDVIHGYGAKKQGVGLVCRLTETGVLRIITVFAL